jgi:hypothetical protein
MLSVATKGSFALTVAWSPGVEGAGIMQPLQCWMNAADIAVKPAVNGVRENPDVPKSDQPWHLVTALHSR